MQVSAGGDEALNGVSLRVSNGCVKRLVDGIEFHSKIVSLQPGLGIQRSPPNQHSSPAPLLWYPPPV